MSPIQFVATALAILCASLISWAIGDMHARVKDMHRIMHDLEVLGKLKAEGKL